ncbi:uncharacterized protein BDFB_004689 [Asbolus verrucosus]|uniref:Uncharacterized protein n=1 Tax=Asbolus verrucosus TaxID=1661398 RepID=A0A482W2Y0_ASBVE|nr:uncharacterized protein BDFB_004689 [Asbolus verrucosus]
MEISLGMDNDSGYVSHYQESNLDSSSENVYSNRHSTHDLYMNEDALLEKPSVKSKERARFDSFDSVINCSQESVKTEFSGFEDSDRSDVSFIIPEVQPIVWNGSGWTERTGESLNRSQESSSSSRQTPLKATHKALANVTNTYENPNQSVMKNVFAESNKENVDPSETPKKQYQNRMSSDISPDLFSEEDELPKVAVAVKRKSPPRNEDHDRDVKMLKRVQSCLGGVYPPPSVTMIQMTVAEMLTKIDENKSLFWTASDASATKGERSRTSDGISGKWPEILKVRSHGFHFAIFSYNRNKLSEDFEHLCSRYAERYVGAETQSSCTVFDTNPSSSHKRKLSKPRWGAKSPGRRLSHLARRRITFSNGNLQGNSNSSILGSRARQILVDAKKLGSLNKKSPKKTPSKSPFKIRKNTPSSSAKKKLAMRFREMAGAFEGGASTSTVSFKRALFNSPKQEKIASVSGGLIEKKSTKRALFSSPLKRPSPAKSPFKLGKRKRNDGDEENPSKFARSASMDVRPTQSKPALNRTLSDSTLRPKTEALSEQHKKKLQWAVYESLSLQNIHSTHPQFKVFASVLARVTRKFLQSARLEGRTTDKMFRIARCHSYAVVKGKSVDEIVNEYMRNKMKNQKPQGYVGIEEFQNSRNRDSSFLDKENIIESIEKRREHAGQRSKFVYENRIDRIKKVISFEDGFNKK